MSTPNARDIPGLLPSTRLGLAFVCFLGTIIIYAVRSNLSFAVVCMVNGTAISELGDTVTETRQSQCLLKVDNSTVDDIKVEGEFVWTKETQGSILGAFFFGYMSSQIIAGYIASRYGGRLVIGFSCLGGAVLTLISPAAANMHVITFMAVRALLGFFQGSIFPAMHAMWSVWAPPLERSVLTGISYAGAQIGNVLVMPMSGLLCKHGPLGGWPSIFYILGFIALVWCGLWFWFVADTPQKHRRISEQERKYIVDSLNKDSDEEKKDHPAVPWKKIFTSKAIWAIFIGHFAGDWGAYMMAMSLPSFLKDVMGFELASMGFISAIPYVLYFIMINVGGAVADTLRNRGVLTTLTTRRVAMILALGSQALFLVLVGFCGCGQETLVVVLITLSIGLSGIQYAGFVVNYLDVAPAFAGPILGIGNTLSGFAGIFAPMVMGWLTPNGTKEEWQLIFFLTGAILILGTVFFCIFAAGDVQPWAQPEIKDPAYITATPLLLTEESEKSAKSKDVTSTV